MKDFWEQRYSESGWAYGTEPNEFLRTQKARLTRGARALVVGDGEGRNGVWLAQQGLDVLSVDYSPAGLKKANKLATAKGTRLRTECVDLEHWNWPVSEFDFVVSIYVHFAPELRPRMHRSMFDALRPGGLLILESFTPAQTQYQSGGPRDPRLLYSADDLRGDFSGATIEQLDETVANLDEGKYHRGPGAVVRMLARKP